jgi:hypothetical protein
MDWQSQLVVSQGTLTDRRGRKGSLVIDNKSTVTISNMSCLFISMIFHLKYLNDLGNGNPKSGRYGFEC